MKKLIMAACLFALVGCSTSPPEVVGVINVGEVISATPIRVGNWDVARTSFETERATIVVLGTINFLVKGETARVEIKSNDRKYFCLNSDVTCFLIPED